MDRAASSISDGDLVDALIHGYSLSAFYNDQIADIIDSRPEQHWGLMPLHAICSTVTPTSLLYGNGPHYGGPNSITFPQWVSVLSTPRCRPAYSTKLLQMAWPEFEAKQIKSTTGRCTNPDAPQSIGR